MMRNLNLKLFSLMLAVVLAYVVNSEGNSSVIAISVPIEVKNTPADKIMVWPSKRELQVTIKGPSFLVAPLASSPPVLRINLPKDVGNRFSAVLSGSELTLPPTVEVLGIEPSQIELMFDDLEAREVKVEVPRIGKLPTDIKLGRIEINPPTLMLSGPASELREISSIETFPIDLREISQNSSMELNVRVPGVLTSVSNRKVAVKISVEDIAKEVRYHNLPVLVENSQKGSSYQAEPSSVSVVVFGPSGVLDKIKDEDLKPYVKISGDYGWADLPVSIDLPEGLNKFKIEPPVVKVKKIQKIIKKR